MKYKMYLNCIMNGKVARISITVDIPIVLAITYINTFLQSASA